MRRRLQEKDAIDEMIKNQMEKIVKEILLSNKKKDKDLTKKSEETEMSHNKNVDTLVKKLTKKVKNNIINSSSEQ